MCVLDSVFGHRNPRRGGRHSHRTERHHHPLARTAAYAGVVFKAVATIKKPIIPNVHQKKVQVRTLPHQNWSFVQFVGVGAVGRDGHAAELLGRAACRGSSPVGRSGGVVSPPPMRGRLWLTCLVTIQPKAQEALVTTTSLASLCAEENFRIFLPPAC